MIKRKVCLASLHVATEKEIPVEKLRAERGVGDLGGLWS